MIYFNLISFKQLCFYLLIFFCFPSLVQILLSKEWLNVCYSQPSHIPFYSSVQFSSVAQSCPTLHDHNNHRSQASLSSTNSRSLLKLIFTELVMPSNHLILCRLLLLLPSIFPSIKVFSNESALRIRWPRYFSFSFNISSSNEHPRLISFIMDLLDLLAV